MNKCTKPDCDCIQIAVEKNGGTDVKSYPCLADQNTPMPTEFKKSKPIPQSSLKEETKIVVWKDGTYKVTEGQTWEYENDENWLTTIKV